MEKENNILQLLTELKKVNPSVKQVKPFHYRIRYNNFDNICKYRQYLENLYQKYRNELTGLPLSHNDKEARKTFFNNIRYELTYVTELIQQQVTENIIPLFPLLNDLKTTDNEKCLYKRYIEKVRHETRKLRLMIQLQTSYTEKAMQYIENKLNNYEITPFHVNGITLTKKIETDYSGKVLSSIIKLMVQLLAKNSGYSKTDLAKITAGIFTTKKSINPTGDYIYNNFTKPLTGKESEELKCFAIQFLNEARRMKENP